MQWLYVLVVVVSAATAQEVVDMNEYFDKAVRLLVAICLIYICTYFVGFDMINNENRKENQSFPFSI